MFALAEKMETRPKQIDESQAEPQVVPAWLIETVEEHKDGCSLEACVTCEINTSEVKILYDSIFFSIS